MLTRSRSGYHFVLNLRSILGVKAHKEKVMVDITEKESHFKCDSVFLSQKEGIVSIRIMMGDKAVGVFRVFPVLEVCGVHAIATTKIYDGTPLDDDGNDTPF